MLHIIRMWQSLLGILAVELALVALALITHPAMAYDGPHYSIILLIDNSQSIADIENPVGSPDGTPPDATQKRIRFARFLVQYMQAFFPGQASVGVISFATEPQPLVDLSPVEQWSRADLAHIRSFNQDKDRPDAERCTDFVKALEAAHSQFAGVSCLSKQERCAVVIFTDGLAKERDNVKRVLNDVKEDGIRVNVLMFAGHKPLGELHPQWRETEEMWADFEKDGLIGSLIFNATRLEARTIYQGILQALTLDEPLAQLSVKEFLETTTITTPIPPFRRYTRLLLLPDNLVDEVWTYEPDIWTGIHRWWIDPPTGEIRATLRASGEMTQTLVYYSVISESYPIFLETQVKPTRQEIGHLVELEARFTVGKGQIVTDTEHFGVEVTIEPGNERMEMIPNPDGRFTCCISRTIPGTYTAVFRPVITMPFVDELVPPEQRDFYVGKVPHLGLITGQYVATSQGIQLPVTVVVDEYASIAGLYTPTLSMITGGSEYPVFMTPQGGGSFSATIRAFSGTDLTLRASLIGGSTKQGVHFDSIMVEKRLVFQPAGIYIFGADLIRKALEVLKQRGTGILGIIVVIAAAGLSIWIMKKRASYPHKSNLVELQEALTRKKGKDTLIKMFGGPADFDSEWISFAREFIKIVVKKAVKKDSSELGE